MGCVQMSTLLLSVDLYVTIICTNVCSCDHAVPFKWYVMECNSPLRMYPMHRVSCVNKYHQMKYFGNCITLLPVMKVMFDVFYPSIDAISLCYSPWYVYWCTSSFSHQFVHAWCKSRSYHYAQHVLENVLSSITMCTVYNQPPMCMSILRKWE